MSAFPPPPARAASYPTNPEAEAARLVAVLGLPQGAHATIANSLRDAHEAGQKLARDQAFAIVGPHTERAQARRSAAKQIVAVLAAFPKEEQMALLAEAALDMGIA